MRQYCSVCKDYLDMAVVEEGGKEEVTWLKCPRCKGILPHMQVEGAAPEPTGDGDDLFTLDKLEESEILEYDAHREYEVGNVIYHRSWNDYGKVVDKLFLPGDRSVIRVQFLNQGNVNLLENARSAE